MAAIRKVTMAILILIEFVSILSASNSFWPPKIPKTGTKKFERNNDAMKETPVLQNDKKKCKVKSCKVFKDICGQHARCEEKDIEGSCQFTCRCHEGYHGVFCEFPDTGVKEPSAVKKEPTDKPVVPSAAVTAKSTTLTSPSTTTISKITTYKSKTTQEQTTTSEETTTTSAEKMTTDLKTSTSSTTTTSKITPTTEAATLKPEPTTKAYFVSTDGILLSKATTVSDITTKDPQKSVEARTPSPMSVHERKKETLEQGSATTFSDERTTVAAFGATSADKSSTTLLNTTKDAQTLTKILKDAAVLAGVLGQDSTKLNR